MPSLNRASDNPCQPDGAHHPHWMVCGDYEDNCWDDLGDGWGWSPYHVRVCCVCNEEWPCTTKSQHVRERREKKEVSSG